MTGGSPRWLYEWERQIYPFIMWHFSNIYWYDPGFGQEVRPSIFFTRGRIGKMYWDKEVGERNAQHLLEKLLTSNLLEEFARAVREDEQAIRAFADEILTTKLEEATPEELARLFEKDAHVYTQQCVGTIRTFNRLGVERLMTFVNGDAKELNTLTVSSKRSDFEKEREELRKLAKEQDAPDFEERLAAHTKRYAYLSCGYADEEPLTIEDFRKEMASLTPVQAPRETREEALDRLGAPADIRRISDALSEFTYAKDQIRNYYNYVHWAERGLIEEASKRLKVNASELKLFTPREVAIALKKGMIDKEEIAKREECCVFYHDEGVDTIISGKEGIAFLEKEISEEEKKKELSGLPANPGKARGKVKIVRKFDDVSGERGFVLVTPMTTPELVPLIKRCVAIVTDEGGITSHAAIVSREMGKPCIIGTGNATTVLKDGDLVEVDAEKGVVRKV